MKLETGITLGIECSTRQGSVALLKDGELLVEQSWIADRVRHNVIFQALDTLVSEAEISYSDISLYAVGRGPGSFSGMRMSFAIAQAVALPGKTEVRAVSSGEALAFAVAQRSDVSQIAVLGDARRGQVWYGLFEADSSVAAPGGRGPARIMNAASSVAAPGGRGPGSPAPATVKQVEDWKLIPYEEVQIPEGATLVSSEAERLQQYFPSMGDSVFPHAKEIAKLALMQTQPVELEPLYMHPPVFIEPKYS
jgi:tRNA threonylcarbamoyl adenosine modification protein YeaZ